MGRIADHRLRKKLVHKAYGLAGALLWCVAANAAPVYSLHIDSAKSYVDAAPLWDPQAPDPFKPIRYGVSGTLEILSEAPSWSSANVRMKEIGILADPVPLPYGLFLSPEGVLGSWEGTAIWFSSNDCAFFVGPGSCWSVGLQSFASGTFDGEHLDIAGTVDLKGPGYGGVADYRIVANIASAQVPEPATLGLMLLGLAFAALRTRAQR